MDYSRKVVLMEAYAEPPEYNPPKDIIELQKSTQYPNMNSVEYRLIGSLQETELTAMQPFLEVIEQNEVGHVLIAGNNYTSRKFCGSFFGYETIGEEPIDGIKSCFRKQTEYFIRAIKFINSTHFILGNSRGSLELWSSKGSDKANGYCLFNLGVENSHIGPISVLDLFEKDKTKCISGSKDGFLKVWDIGDRDLYVATTIAYAHCDEITGLSTNKTNTSLFVTSSRDKAAFIWDLRQNKQATALYDEHEFAFTNLHWSSSNSQILLADETGTLYHIDDRKPNQFVKSIQVFDEAIHRIRNFEGKTAVVGDNQTIKVYNDQFEILYEDSNAPDYLRDILWSKSATNTFYTIGWDSHLKKHTFP